MDALLASLRALSLLPPSPSQLLQLLANHAVEEDEAREIRDLARVLSLGAYDPDDDGEEEARDVTGGFGIDRELIEDAVVEIIRTFKRDVSKMRSMYEEEENLRRQPCPLGRPTPLHFLKLRHESAVRQNRKFNELYGGYRPRLLFSGGPSWSSQKELHELKAPTAETKALLGQRLEGMYLVVKVVTPPAIYVGASLLVTLPKPFGCSLPLSISHFTRDPTQTEELSARQLPAGTLMALKEPYFSPHHAFRASGCSGGAGLRIDTPTDVVVLSGPGESSEQVTDWRHAYLAGLEWAVEAGPPAKKGKKTAKASPEECSLNDSSTAFAPGSQSAAWLQEGALSRSHLEARALDPSSLSRASIVQTVEYLLSQERPGAAWRELMAAERRGLLETASAAGPLMDLHELRGDILYRLSAWKEASNSFSKAVDTASLASPSVTQKLADAHEREKEASTGPSGCATSERVYFAHLASPCPRIQLADWLSPKLRVQDIPNAGRGLVTTAPVSAGTPLLMAKSRGSSFPLDEPFERCPILRCDFENGVMSTTTQVMATTNLIHSMIDRPELTQEILGLTAGPGTSDSPWVKAGHFEKAEPSLTSEGSGQLLTIDRIGPKGGINALYVDEVLRHNAFGPGMVRKQGSQEESSNQPSLSSRRVASAPGTSTSFPRALQQKLARDPPSAFTRSTQPHPLPAILNHSCLPNVSSVFLGDVVITRALRDLQQGEEIGHEYVRGGVDYATRQSTLSKHGFICACSLCDLDRADGQDALTTRRRIFAVKVPAVFARSDALLRHCDGGSALSVQDVQNHTDIREALQDLAHDLEETYNNLTRGLCRPEMREVSERIARHAAREGQSKLAVLQYLRSLQSVDAKLTGEWQSLVTPGRRDMIDASWDEISHAELPLVQAPALHVDEAQATLWRLSQLLASSGHHHKSLLWSRAAYWVHSVLIGGGVKVFTDRWGPTNAEEERTLEWKQAWDLWKQSHEH
ncbi:unnamed protein product [Parajaminaea phylloscopi]